MEFGTLGKIELDYIEASRQCEKLVMVRNLTVSNLEALISSIEELAALVDYPCNIDSADLIENQLNYRIDEIQTRMKYEIEKYQNLALEVALDIEKLNEVVESIMNNNTKEYQRQLKKEKLNQHEFVYYNQISYGDTPYGSSTIASSGCGPTSVAMILSTLLYEEITPVEMCNYSYEHGFLLPGGTPEYFFDNVLENYDVTYVKDEQTEENIITRLEEGNLIIAHVGPSKFTSGGHYIVLRGLDENGNVLVADPYSEERSQMVWSAEYLARIRRGKNMYSVSV